MVTDVGDTHVMCWMEWTDFGRRRYHNPLCIRRTEQGGRLSFLLFLLFFFLFFSFYLMINGLVGPWNADMKDAVREDWVDNLQIGDGREILLQLQVERQVSRRTVMGHCICK